MVASSTCIKFPAILKHYTKPLSLPNGIVTNLLSTLLQHLTITPLTFSSPKAIISDPLLPLQNSTIHLWLEKGADPKKLILGMPLYGQSFGLGWKANGTGLNQHAPQKGQAGQYTRAAGFLAYYEVSGERSSKCCL